MDTARWPQGIGFAKTGVEAPKPPGVAEKKPRPQKEQAVNCPRCNSTNTKFCYYNNYSLSQPRYFCKTCRRYWTEGGSLRNVPVGGGSRKNKRSSSSSSSAAAASASPPTSMKKGFPDPNLQNPNKIHEGQDLNLAYNPSYNSVSDFVGAPFGIDGKNLDSGSHHFPVMELFKTGNLSSGLSSFMSGSNSVYTSSSGFPVSEFKPSLGFSVENYGNLNHGVEDHANSSRILFPFEELKVNPVSNDQFEQDRGGEGNANAYWNGMLGSW